MLGDLSATVCGGEINGLVDINILSKCNFNSYFISLSLKLCEMSAMWYTIFSGV